MKDFIIANETTIYNNGKKRADILLINSPKIIYRVAYVQKDEQKATWQQVCDSFPIGDLLNENTHSFDSKIYANDNTKIHLIAAVPKQIIEQTLLKFKSWIKIMEPIECRLIDLYKNEENTWLVFQQGENLRVIVIIDQLPSMVRLISIKTMDIQLSQMDIPKKIHFINIPYIDNSNISLLNEFCNKNNIIRSNICTQ